MTTFFLRWMDESGEQVLPLAEEEVIVGRRSDCGVVLANPYVSRQHVKLVKEGEGYVLEDLQSTHGTYVNGERVSRVRLTHGDRIHLGRGRVELVFLENDPQAPALSPSENELEKSMLNLTSVLHASTQEFSNLEKISYILDFQYNWEKSFSADSTFRQILDSALKISGAERGFILLKEDSEFRYVVGMNGQGSLLSEAEFKTSRSIVKQVAQEGVPVFMSHGIDQQFAQQESIVAMQLRAVACMPLSWVSSQGDEAAVKGILYLDSTKAMHALSGLDQKILNKLALEAANVFQKLEMIEAIEERKAFEKELDMAQETQRALLPLNLPRFEGYFVTAFSQPTRYVGGDFYDFLHHRSGEMTGVLADVSGKGIPAALLSSLIQGALEMECRAGRELDEALARVNRYLCEKSSSNRFVTLFIFRLDQEGKGVFLSAGHNPAYLFRKASQEIEELVSEDLILGAFDFAQYHSQPLRLDSGDVLVIYSDGVTEAMNPAGEMFGEERFKELIRQNASAGGGRLEQVILDALDDFTQGMAQTDDITFLLVEKE